MAVPGASPANPLERCHRNYAETLWQYVRGLPGAARRDLSDATLIRCDLPSSIANVLFFVSPKNSPSERLAEARRFFGPKVPWRVLASGDRASWVGRSAETAGLRPAPNEPGMLLDPMRPVPSVLPSVTIRPVVDGPGLSDFGVVWSGSFGIPRWVLPVALPRMPPDDPEHGAQNRFFVGYVHGAPVACATLTVTEGVAGIASVGTLRSARGRGLGTAMTWAAVDAGRELGADVAYLAASPMGYPVYERMGFRRVAEYPSWQVRFGFFATLGAFWRLRGMVRHPRTSGSSPTPAAEVGDLDRRGRP
jgi:GNAT superfamily N-acetyltransferase